MKKQDINIETLKKLSMIHLTEDESNQTLDKLSDIMEMIDEIIEVKVTNIKPLSNPLEQTQPLRLDEATEKNQSEKYQTNAPKTKDGYYVVPQVVE